jgi:hypothetical protein
MLEDIVMTERSGQRVYHYTKASNAIDHILPTMMIRLGCLAETNDPSERIFHMHGFASRGVGTPEADAFLQAQTLVNGHHLVACCRFAEGRDPGRVSFAEGFPPRR